MSKSEVSNVCPTRSLRITNDRWKRITSIAKDRAIRSHYFTIGDLIAGAVENEYRRLKPS